MVTSEQSSHPHPVPRCLTRSSSVSSTSSSRSDISASTSITSNTGNRADSGNGKGSTIIVSNDTHNDGGDSDSQNTGIDTSSAISSTRSHTASGLARQGILGRASTMIPFVSLLFVVLAIVLSMNKDVSFATATAQASAESATRRVNPGSALASESISISEFAPTKRGKPIGDSFDSKALYGAYKEIQTEYLERAFASAGSATQMTRTLSNDRWKVLVERDGIQVSMMEHASDPNCPYVRMTAIIPTSVEDCWDFLQLSNWGESMPKMDPFYESVAVYGEFQHNRVHMLLAHKQTKRILAFGKRDFVFLSVSDRPLADGTLVSGTVSVQTPKIPRQAGYTRAFQDSIAFYTPRKQNQETMLTIVCRMDLNDSTDGGSGGSMPMWLYVKTIGATGARSVLNMREALVQRKEQRQKEEALAETTMRGKRGGQGLQRRPRPLRWLKKRWSILTGRIRTSSNETNEGAQQLEDWEPPASQPGDASIVTSAFNLLKWW